MDLQSFFIWTTLHGCFLLCLQDHPQNTFVTIGLLDNWSIFRLCSDFNVSLMPKTVSVRTCKLCMMIIFTALLYQFCYFSWILRFHQIFWCQKVQTQRDRVLWRLFFLGGGAKLLIMFKLYIIVTYIYIYIDTVMNIML